MTKDFADDNFKWHPIEIDGTSKVVPEDPDNVFLYDEGGFVSIGYLWRTDDGRYYNKEGKHWYWMLREGEDNCDHEFTHWHPFPDPPADKGGTL